MDILDPVRYARSHETPWQPPSAGAASPTRPRAAQEGPDPVGRRRAARVLAEFGLPVGRRLSAGRPKSLAPKPIPGRPPKLSPRQKQRLVRVLLQGPLTAGYGTDLWTTQRIADVIQRRLSVSYHPHSIWGLLRGLGWSCQKPERRALQRNERAIAYWRRSVWPHIKKG